jgi:hypothetical protein
MERVLDLGVWCLVSGVWGPGLCAPCLGRDTEENPSQEEEQLGYPASHVSQVGRPRRVEKPPHLRLGMWNRLQHNRLTDSAFAKENVSAIERLL